MGLLSADFVQYAPDPYGAYQQWRPEDYAKMFARAGAAVDSTFEVLRVESTGEEIILTVVRSRRRAKTSGIEGEYVVASLVNVVDGKITRMVQLAEQADFEFWRSVEF